MTDLLTIVMPTSPIPSHPSTEVIEESVRRLREYPELKDCEILITIDGIREEQKHREADYEEYKRRLLWLTNKWENVYPIIFDEHAHQSGMMRHVLEMIRTPLVFYVEHDTYPMGEIDFVGICRAILNNPDTVKQVRMHIFDSVLPEHGHLMLDKVPLIIEGVPMIRTIQWSQRPHICTVEYYRWIMDEYFALDAKTMIEDAIWPIAYHQYVDGLIGFEKFGLWIYAPGDLKTGMLRSGTTDGRQDDPKYKMHFSYPNGVPHAAPVNR